MTQTQSASPYLKHLGSNTDLVTTYEATRAGFVALALEKNRKAVPYISQAFALQTAASIAKQPEDLLKLKAIQKGLLTAAGISDKALKYLQPEDITHAIQNLIKNFLEPAGDKFIEELVFRFLLTSGDALGGSMRNIGGVLAQRKVIRSILSTLILAGRAYQWQHAKSRNWIKMSEDDADIELSLRGLSWKTDHGERTLICNLKVPAIENNVDMCLFNLHPKDVESSKFREKTSFIAFGELKGGIDPAGADEHWKTARTALNRIQTAFANITPPPHTFFIGAAIEKKMSGEIWNQLERGILSNAANLNDEKQVSSLSLWLCNL